MSIVSHQAEDGKLAAAKFAARFQAAACEEIHLLVRIAYATTKVHFIKITSSDTDSSDSDSEDIDEMRSDVSNNDSGIIDEAMNDDVSLSPHVSPSQRSLGVQALCAAAAQDYACMVSFLLQRGVNIGEEIPKWFPAYNNELHSHLSSDGMLNKLFCPSPFPERGSIPMRLWATPFYASAPWGRSSRSCAPPSTCAARKHFSNYNSVNTKHPSKCW